MAENVHYYLKKKKKRERERESDPENDSGSSGLPPQFQK